MRQPIGQARSFTAGEWRRGLFACASRGGFCREVAEDREQRFLEALAVTGAAGWPESMEC